MPIPFGKEKVYNVECPACGISETMIFLKRLGGFFYRHLPTTSFDVADGKEQESVFKPIKGIMGDSPPEKCPKCGGKLKGNKHPIRH